MSGLMTALMFLTLAIGVVHGFMTYLWTFRKSGGSDSFFISHFFGVILGFAIFVPYFFLSAVFLYFAD